MEVKEKLTTIDKIKTEYQKIQGKTNFIIELSALVNRAKGTIRNHWFGGFWEIPIEHQENVLKIITNKIKSQNEPRRRKSQQDI